MEHGPIRRDWLNTNLPEMVQQIPQPKQETYYFGELLFGDPHEGDLPIDCMDAPLVISLALTRRTVMH